MLALGPLFEEKEAFDEHKPLRDQMATLEYEIAEHLRNMNYDVLGTHQKGTVVSQNTLEELRLKYLNSSNKFANQALKPIAARWAAPA